MKKKTSPWFKVLALCTAVGLGGTYVWRQQQAAAPQTQQPAERADLPVAVNKVIAPTPRPAEQEKTDRVLMPGSKSSSSIFNPEQTWPMMPGSKAGMIELKPAEPKDRVLLPSSKSIPMPIFRERRPTPEDQPKSEEP